jgi:hypothetical protein
MCDFKDEKTLCKCKAAVLTAYHEMLGHSMPECFAREAATLVYRHHHPEDTKELSRLKVESWIHAGHLH